MVNSQIDYFVESGMLPVESLYLSFNREGAVVEFPDSAEEISSVDIISNKENCDA
jgi:hypothetical protein